MKAVVFEKHGGLNVLKYRDVPMPKIGETEVLVEVKACALNHLDIWTRQGLPGIKIPLPHILGCESAGVVSKVGHRVKEKIKVGDRVLVAPGVSCGKCAVCKSGQENQCAHYTIMGFRNNGGYAEFVKAPARNIIKINEKLSFDEWAALPLCFLTAYSMLFNKGNLQKGQTVLIHAAGSGVGSAAIQLAKWKKAHILTTAGSDSKLKKAKKLGAHEGINYQKKDIAREVKRITKDKGVDLALDHIGPATFTHSLASLKKGGRLVTCGATTGPQVTLDLRFIFSREISIHGTYMGDRKELNKVVKLAKEGVIKPVVDTVYPLVAAKEAQKKMQGRRFFGKLVLEP